MLLLSKSFRVDKIRVALTAFLLEWSFNKCVCVLQRIALSDMTRSEINEMLAKLAFYKKAQPEEEVPEEFRFSPAKDSPFKDEPAHRPSTSPEPQTEAEHTDL